MGNRPILLTNLSLSLGKWTAIAKYSLSRSPLSLIQWLVASQSCMLYIYLYNIFHYFFFRF